MGLAALWADLVDVGRDSATLDEESWTEPSVLDPDLAGVAALAAGVAQLAGPSPAGP